MKNTFAKPSSGKFGTFAGVFTPSVLTILGLIMYLRFPWVVGHVGLVGALIMTPFGLMEWQSPDNWWTWLLFGALGFWGGLGHWLIILAHRLAPAAVLAPYIYLGLVWMSGFGFVIFDDIPSWWTIAGALIVIMAGLYLLARERIAEEQERKQAKSSRVESEFDPSQ